MDSGAAMRVAIVDQGTNSARLLLAEVEGGVVRTIARRAAVTRLGRGVDEHRRLDAAAAQRTRECIAGYAREIVAFAPERRLLIATSVLRDARDGVAFLDRVAAEFDLPWQVVSGAQEAALSYRGAVSGAPTVRRPLLVVDIGGGSTELSVGEGARPSWSVSIDIGVVRLTERFFATDPPRQGEWSAAEDAVARLLAAETATGTVAVAAGIGVGGTITTLVAHKLALRAYDPRVVHGHFLSLADIERAIAAFRGMTSRERAALPGIQRGREDVIPAGALIARAICRHFALQGLCASEVDILDGAALALAEGAAAAPALLTF